MPYHHIQFKNNPTLIPELFIHSTIFWEFSHDSFFFIHARSVKTNKFTIGAYLITQNILCSKCVNTTYFVLFC